MGIQLPGDCQRKILDVAVIRGSQNEVTSRPQNLGCKARERPRPGNVLDNFGGNDDVKIVIAKNRAVVIHAEKVKWNMRKSATCKRDAVLAWVAAYHLKACRRQSATQGAVAATKVQNPPGRNPAANRKDVVGQVSRRMWCVGRPEMVFGSNRGITHGAE